jgi:hypothetical protein
MEQSWFEMAELRRRKLIDSTWIPLRASVKLEDTGTFAQVGYRQQYFGAGTVAIPVEQAVLATELTWSDTAPDHSHRPGLSDSQYFDAAHFGGYRNGLTGIHLVLEQRRVGSKRDEWHLNQDVVLALDLFREGDTWVRPEEGYLVVARLSRSDDGTPLELQIRSEHLRDYLAARKMGLHTSRFYERDEILADESHISWEDESTDDRESRTNWSGRVMPSLDTWKTAVSLP